MKTIYTSQPNLELIAENLMKQEMPFTESLEVIDTLIKLYPGRIQFRRIGDSRVLSCDDAEQIRNHLGQDIR